MNHKKNKVGSQSFLIKTGVLILICFLSTNHIQAQTNDSISFSSLNTGDTVYVFTNRNIDTTGGDLSFRNDVNDSLGLTILMVTLNKSDEIVNHLINYDDFIAQSSKKISDWLLFVHGDSSLCVLDTKKRGFSKEEHTSLNKLAKLVNERLEAITKNRRQTQLDLTEATLKPALSELSNSLKSIQDFMKLSYSAGTSIRTFLNHSNHLFSNESEYSEAIRLSLESATKANQLNENLLIEIEFAVYNSLDYVNALEQIVMNIESIKLSEIVMSAQDLSRNATKLIGGFALPDFKSDPKIYSNGNLAIAIITNCLLIISSELGKSGSKNGISLVTNEHDKIVELLFSAKDLSKSSIATVLNDLKNLIGSDHPSIIIDSIDEKIRLNFSTVHIKATNKA
jgi:hypothetical protein